jgi:predicted dehydrogenase
MDFFRQDETRNCYAIGEKGTLRWNGISGVVDTKSEPSNEWEMLFIDDSKMEETYRAEWENFLQCISDNQPPNVSIVDGLKVVQVIEAVRLSSALEKKIFVNNLYDKNEKNL